MLSYHNRPFWVEHNVRRFLQISSFMNCFENFLRKLRLHKYEKYLFTRMFVLQKFVWKKARLQKKKKKLCVAECLLVRMCVSGGACYPECTCQNALLTGKNVHVCETMLTGKNVHVCESMLTDKNVQAKGVFTGNSVGGWKVLTGKTVRT